jgi:hypothetical protein
VKKDDIEVGEEYAASRDNDYRRYSSGVRVRVTGPPEYRETASGRPVGPWQVPVTYPDGETRYGRLGAWVPTRQIREPWADYEESQKRAAEAEAKRAAEQGAARQVRLAEAAKLAQRLRDAGMEDSTQMISWRREPQDYGIAGLDVVIDSDGNGHLRAPLAHSLKEYVEHDKPVAMPMPDALWLADDAAQWVAHVALREGVSAS